MLGCAGLREGRRMSVREGMLLVSPAVLLAALALVYFALSSVAGVRRGGSCYRVGGTDIPQQTGAHHPK
jgi:hypothetical protein